ncbi:hypothetical protein DPMN_126379 [Dreissena polymorpha]|uniref:Uncharacterized protein n=1 Tax=Dreissena polymorpha TaxID=45954 RepID=A0A9D4JXW8_DREPO|nr:hypothetical protein DPMN_126379 [Dreissena polymorpha]
MKTFCHTTRAYHSSKSTGPLGVFSSLECNLSFSFTMASVRRRNASRSACSEKQAAQFITRLYLPLAT